MIPADGMRRVYEAKWVRVAAVSLATGLVVTSLFMLSGRSASVLVALERMLIYTASLGGVAGWTLPRVARRLRGLSVAVRWGVMIPVLLGVAVAGTCLASGLALLVGIHHRDSFWRWFVADLRVDALVMVAVGIAMVLYESQRAQLNAVTLELRTKELERERAQKMAIEARLASLESHLHPHFLFNTLNSISALIQENPDQAERMVERLASLLRFSLDVTERSLVPLAHELKVVADYLEIERTRLGERLVYALNVQPDAMHFEIPPLTVQTLVENSIKHAIAPRPSGGHVRVEASALGDQMILTVWDDGPGFTSAAIRPGHGLDNLHGRLAGRFGSAAALSISRRDDGTLVTVSFPRTRDPSTATT